ncbi:MAG: glycoside hydrolase family 3 N-terminal domain-containing protein, partial [Kiloniellales bacterium]
AVRFNARLIAEELRELGISVNCAPLLDIPAPGADDVIGDRAFGGGNPSLVADLGRAFCDGLLAGGVLPVIKHIPGHGRARVDTHEALPVVETPLAELEATDFQPFKALSDMPWAMTAHLVYAALDPGNPASHSRAVIEEVIRGTIGFDGVLVSDDISMGALEGDYADRAARILAAGCDLVLHCNGEREEMTAVAEGAAAALSADAERRLAAAAARPKSPEPIDRKGLATRIDKMLGDL